MTNYEKYKDLVISCILKDSICDLAHTVYGDAQCDNRTCEECSKFTTEWLKRECSKIDWAKIDWAKVPIDTPILIEDEKGFIFSHFAKYWNGNVFAYANGQTSWTTDGETEAWDPYYVKFRRDEDLKKYAK